MTAAVVTAGLEATVKEAATVLAENGIPGLPVVDGGGRRGRLSEADVLATAVTEGAARGRGWSRLDSVRRVPAEGCLVAAVLLWSFNFTAFRYGITHGFAPLAYAPLHWALAGIALLGLARLRGHACASAGAAS